MEARKRLKNREKQLRNELREYGTSELSKRCE
jgi:hypothetical protein